MVAFECLYSCYMYLQNDSVYFGAIVGRVANRIGGAQFELNGVQYKLVANDGNNTLHGIHVQDFSFGNLILEYIIKNVS